MPASTRTPDERWDGKLQAFNFGQWSTGNVTHFEGGKCEHCFKRLQIKSILQFQRYIEGEVFTYFNSDCWQIILAGKVVVFLKGMFSFVVNLI